MTYVFWVNKSRLLLGASSWGKHIITQLFALRAYEIGLVDQLVDPSAEIDLKFS